MALNLHYTLGMDLHLCNFNNNHDSSRCEKIKKEATMNKLTFPVLSYKSALTIALVYSLGLLIASSNAHATQISLNFNSQGYSGNSLESGGSFTWTDINGSGVDLTWAVGGSGTSTDVNDNPSGSGLSIGQNNGGANGTIHEYAISFSQAVKNVQFSILNINRNAPASLFQYHDLLTFSAGATFSNLAGGVTTSGLQLLPPVGTTDIEMADITYSDYTNGFTITHGGALGNVNPGFLRFPSISFEIPTPSTALLFGLGLIGLISRRRG
jgi:hypothetical protein